MLLLYGSSYSAPRIEILEAQRTYELWRLRIAETIAPHSPRARVSCGRGLDWQACYRGGPLASRCRAKLRIDEAYS